MTLNLECSAHARACNRLCRGCLQRVNTILSGPATSRHRVPNPNNSIPLNKYICNLAAIRWEVIWEVSSQISPNRLCTTCRLILTKDPLNWQSPVNICTPSRQHTLASTWTPGECSLCDMQKLWGGEC